jgi:hypothetical protein
VRLIGTCLTIALLLSTPAWAAKKPKGHHPAGGAQQSELHSRGQAACGLAAHETDGTTTCLDRAPDTMKDDTEGAAVGAATRDRDAPTGMQGLPGGPGSY